MDEERTCKYCGSTNIVKYGTYNNVQRWWCKDCKRKFKEDTALFHMKTPANQVASALSMYYEGMSLNAIRRQLRQDYDNYPSDATVYEWILKYTDTAVNKAKDYRPDVGSIWVADETVLKIDGSNIWFWDIIDTKTRFLLASHVSNSRHTVDAKKLVELASRCAGKVPRVIITDKLNAYLDGIELAFGADTEHIQSKPFEIQNKNNIIERFHGTLKARTKVMRGLKSLETAKFFTDGWLVHYNFLRPHGSLKDRTPAEVAGVKFPCKNWADITLIAKPKTRVALKTVICRMPVSILKRRMSKKMTKRRDIKPMGRMIMTQRERK